MASDNNKNIMHQAGAAALLFGCISGGLILLETLLARPGSSLTWLAALLDIAEMAGLIVLMAALMNRQVRTGICASRSDTFRYGRWIAFFSSVITAAFAYINWQYAFPDNARDVMDQVYAAAGSVLDSNGRSALQNLEANFALYVFFAQWLWCWLYGVILSAILSRFIPGRKAADPFAGVAAPQQPENDTPDEQ